MNKLESGGPDKYLPWYSKKDNVFLLQGKEHPLDTLIEKMINEVDLDCPNVDKRANIRKRITSYLKSHINQHFWDENGYQLITYSAKKDLYMTLRTNYRAPEGNFLKCVKCGYNKTFDKRRECKSCSSIEKTEVVSEMLLAIYNGVKSRIENGEFSDKGITFTSSKELYDSVISWYVGLNRKEVSKKLKSAWKKMLEYDIDDPDLLSYFFGKSVDEMTRLNGTLQKKLWNINRKLIGSYLLINSKNYDFSIKDSEGMFHRVDQGDFQFAQNTAGVGLGLLRLKNTDLYDKYGGDGSFKDSNNTQFLGKDINKSNFDIPLDKLFYSKKGGSQDFKKFNGLLHFFCDKPKYGEDRPWPMKDVTSWIRKKVTENKLKRQGSYGGGESKLLSLEEILKSAFVLDDDHLSFFDSQTSDTNE